ncbi:serine/threonine-protein kinase [Kribbella sp. NPDC004875]|uniref:serine/threonine-protein kinase n=1 Tax=Kribbella sp. NPDC004875 TaxID=3364107 RepID=UPI0036C81B37
MRDADEGLVAGRYRLHELLGRGGMGTVYRATDEVLVRPVAVKLMTPLAEPESLARPERFLREARVSARIQSPHVVATYDFGRDHDRYFIAMELVKGSSVADELRRTGPFPADAALRIVRQAAAGLAAAHQLGIVHRDVKTANLVLDDDGAVKLADFGIARILDDATTTMTSNGQIMGTTHYLAPERALGHPAEPPADVYALGCVLYQLVTGHPPFMAESPASIMYQHVEVAPSLPSDLRPDLAGEVEALILWMLDKDPGRRPTASQIAHGVQPMIGADATTTEYGPVRRRRTKAMLAGVGAVFALVVAATVGIVLETRGSELPATNDFAPAEPARPPTLAVVPQRTTPTPVRTSSPTTTTERSAHTKVPVTARPRAKPQTHAKEPSKPKKAKPPKPKKPKH